MTKSKILVAFIVGLIGLGIFLNIFGLGFVSDLKILFLIALWILAVRLYKFEGKISIAASLMFLVFCLLFLVLNKERIAAKFLIWTYLFFLLGAGQQFLNSLSKTK